MGTYNVKFALLEHVVSDDDRVFLREGCIVMLLPWCHWKGDSGKHFVIS